MLFTLISILIFILITIIGNKLNIKWISLIGLLGYTITFVFPIRDLIQEQEKTQKLCNSTCEPYSVKACNTDYVICGDNKVHWFKERNK